MTPSQFSAEANRLLQLLVAEPKNDRAWSEFHRLVQRFVGSQVQRLVRASDVDDVTQDAFTRVVQQIERGNADGVSDSVAWLKRIALCAAIDYRRRREAVRRRSGPSLAIDESTQTPARKSTITPDLLAIVAENVGRAVDSLTPAEKRLYQELASGRIETAQLAKALGVREGTLAVRISRLKAKIVSALQE